MVSRCHHLGLLHDLHGPPVNDRSSGLNIIQSQNTKQRQATDTHTLTAPLFTATLLRLTTAALETVTGTLLQHEHLVVLCTSSQYRALKEPL